MQLKDENDKLKKELGDINLKNMQFKYKNDELKNTLKDYYKSLL
jgi:hypothetical protein